LNEVIIKLKRCTLILSENDLFKLPDDVIKKAIGKGKARQRALANENRQAGIDRWQVYEWLKGYKVPENAASLIESATAKEVKEGCIEYLSMKSRTKQQEVYYGN
jgi:hypothetical protein